MFFKKKKEIELLKAQIEDQCEQINEMHNEIMKRGDHIDYLKNKVRETEDERDRYKNRLTDLEKSPRLKQPNINSNAMRTYTETITPQLYKSSFRISPEDNLPQQAIERELALQMVDTLVNDHVIRFYSEGDHCTATLSVVPWDKTATLSFADLPPVKEIEK